jgi:isocitrate dehydrogenase
LTGSLLGTVGRTVGGAVASAGNAVENVVGGVGIGTGEVFQGQFKAAGRSYGDAIKNTFKAPIDATRTALSGTMGLFQTTGDEIAYLVDAKGTKISSINPKEKVTVAFGCKTQQ